MAFLEKPICPFPQETKVGEKEGWKQHLGPDRAERERPRDVQRAALLGVALSFHGSGGTTADGDKGPVVLVGAFVQEPVCRRGGPVASGPGGRPVSATAGFLLGRAVHLNGVLPHCVFLLLEDPGGGEGGGSAAEELLGWT